MQFVQTKRITEAIAAECLTCGGQFMEYQSPWPMRKSIGLHERNGQCGGRKAMRFYAFKAPETVDAIHLTEI
jgi:hypothetical protein